MKTYTLPVTVDEAEVLARALKMIERNYSRRLATAPNHYGADMLRWKTELVESLQGKLATV